MRVRCDRGRCCHLVPRQRTSGSSVGSVSSLPWRHFVEQLSGIFQWPLRLPGHWLVRSAEWEGTQGRWLVRSAEWMPRAAVTCLRLPCGSCGSRSGSFAADMGLLLRGGAREGSGNARCCMPDSGWSDQNPTAGKKTCDVGR
jgi:hypothetical protein